MTAAEKKCDSITGPRIMPGWGCCACAKTHHEGRGDRIVNPGGAVAPDLPRQGRLVRVLLADEHWDLLASILDAIDCEGAEDGTAEGYEKGLFAGFHIGALRAHEAHLGASAAAALASLKARYKEALMCSAAVGDKEGVLRAMGIAS